MMKPKPVGSIRELHGGENIKIKCADGIWRCPIRISPDAQEISEELRTIVLLCHIKKRLAALYKKAGGKRKIIKTTDTDVECQNRIRKQEHIRNRKYYAKHKEELLLKRKAKRERAKAENLIKKEEERIK